MFLNVSSCVPLNLIRGWESRGSAGRVEMFAREGVLGDYFVACSLTHGSGEKNPGQPDKRHLSGVSKPNRR